MDFIRSERHSHMPGKIQFAIEWQKSAPLKGGDEILKWHRCLYQLKLVGAHPDGVGYGNISQRHGRSFLITGCGVGAIAEPNERHLSSVEGYDIEGNSVRCLGPIAASSESLTHAALYEAAPWVQAVIHVHSPGLWDKYLGKLATTAASAAAGTPAMAREIRRIMLNQTGVVPRILVMGGHPAGLVAYGASLADAGRIIGTAGAVHEVNI